jgi:hypothetical protein
VSTSDRERRRGRSAKGSGSLLVPAAVVVLVGAALGFAIARSGDNGHSPAALGNHASAGVIRIAFPSTWHRQTPPTAPQLNLSDELAIAPPGSTGEMLLVGRTVSGDPQLLPHALLDSLSSVPTAQTVTLGSATVYRYLNLTPRGQRTESIYAMSTTVGTVLGICVAPAVQPGFFGCGEPAPPTLVLTSGTALPPGPIPDYASALDAAIKRLNGVSVSVGSQLASAPAAAAQAKAAGALAAAHAQAATTLSHLHAGPATGANFAVVAALRRADKAYLALGRAASRQDSTGYQAARASVAHAATALTAAYSKLAGFGYSVS